jgi:hypothetical protein
MYSSTEWTAWTATRAMKLELSFMVRFDTPGVYAGRPHPIDTRASASTHQPDPPARKTLRPWRNITSIEH